MTREDCRVHYMNVTLIIRELSHQRWHYDPKNRLDINIHIVALTLKIYRTWQLTIGNKYAGFDYPPVVLFHLPIRILRNSLNGIDFWPLSDFENELGLTIHHGESTSPISSVLSEFSFNTKILKKSCHMP